MTVLAVFRSRAQTMDFAARLQSVGASVRIVNTPKEAGVGCGVSARFGYGALALAENVLRRNSYSSFAGFYEVREGYGASVLRPLPGRRF